MFDIRKFLEDEVYPERGDDNRSMQEKLIQDYYSNREMEAMLKENEND